MIGRRGLLKGALAMVFGNGNQGRQRGAWSDGLVRPVNAPPAASSSLGVQPGVSTGPVYARYVIIFGQPDGWFVYSGTPKLGNPPIAWGASGTKDPYGNTLPNGSTLGIASTATFSAGNTVMTPAGTFTYSGTPALGNLIASKASAAGTDVHGNAYLAGTVGYATSGATWNAVVLGTGTSYGAYFYWASAPGGPWTLEASLQNDSSGNLMLVTGSSGIVSVQNVTNNPVGVALAPFGSPGASALGPVLYGSAGGVPSAVTMSGFAGELPLTQSDTSANSNPNLAGAQPITKTWTIPAGDAQVGTVYEVETDFHGTFENQTLTWSVSLDGTSIDSRAIGPAFFTAGTAFDGYIKARIQVATTGASGTVNAFLEGGVGDDGNRSSGTNSNSAVISARTLGSAFDTTAAHTLAVTATWGGSTAGQTITGYGSVYTRKGP